MQRAELLQALDIGNSVAEFDRALERYFVETALFRDFVADRYDIVSGDKGTGKTAIFRFVTEHRRDYDELRDIELLPAFNVVGQPVFFELTRSPVLTEGEYNSLWKAYILSVAGNYLIEMLGTEGRLKEVEEILSLSGLKVGDYRPESIFQRLKTTFKGFLKPKAVEGSVSVLETGLPVVTGKVVPDYGEEVEGGNIIPHDYALSRLQDALEELGLTVWVVFDRLDEAFQGAPDHEVPALRALLRVYLDLNHLERVRVKLFIRNDLFSRITTGGFVNLTHVNARRLHLSWSPEDLLDLLTRRVLDNSTVVEAVGLDDPSSIDNDEARLELLEHRIFRDQVDPGQRKPTTWNWILSRIRDGQDIRPPRNLIDLVDFAREAQLREDEREKAEWQGPPLIDRDAIKRGLSRLSAARLEDTLMAEYPNLQVYFDQFRGAKAEHNRDSLAEQLGLLAPDLDAAVDGLTTSGFLERTGATWKVRCCTATGLGSRRERHSLPTNPSTRTRRPTSPSKRFCRGGGGTLPRAAHQTRRAMFWGEVRARRAAFAGYKSAR
jgi:hypothetical protein